MPVHTVAAVRREGDRSGVTSTRCDERQFRKLPIVNCQLPIEF
jgi:hypothetical protein